MKYIRVVFLSVTDKTNAFELTMCKGADIYDITRLEKRGRSTIGQHQEINCLDKGILLSLEMLHVWNSWQNMMKTEFLLMS